MLLPADFFLAGFFATGLAGVGFESFFVRGGWRLNPILSAPWHPTARGPVPVAPNASRRSRRRTGWGRSPRRTTTDHRRAPCRWLRLRLANDWPPARSERGTRRHRSVPRRTRGWPAPARWRSGRRPPGVSGGAPHRGRRDAALPGSGPGDEPSAWASRGLRSRSRRSCCGSGHRAQPRRGRPRSTRPSTRFSREDRAGTA